MATTTSEPPPTMRCVLSPEPSITMESFDQQIQTADPLVPPPVDPQQPAVLFPPVQCQAPGQAAMTPVLLPGCPMPPMPTSTPSPGQCRARKHLLIQLFNHLPNTLETVRCWIALHSWLMTTMDILPSILATAWALPHP